MTNYTKIKIYNAMLLHKWAIPTQQLFEKTLPVLDNMPRNVLHTYQIHEFANFDFRVVYYLCADSNICNCHVRIYFELI